MFNAIYFKINIKLSFMGEHFPGSELHPSAVGCAPSLLSSVPARSKVGPGMLRQRVHHVLCKIFIKLQSSIF